VPAWHLIPFGGKDGGEGGTGCRRDEEGGGIHLLRAVVVKWVENLLAKPDFWMIDAALQDVAAS